jgi:hypothetical protein
MPYEFVQAFVEFFAVQIIYALATPFILISARFRESGVRGGYAAVRDGQLRFALSLDRIPGLHTCDATRFPASVRECKLLGMDAGEHRILKQLLANHRHGVIYSWVGTPN